MIFILDTIYPIGYTKDVKIIPLWVYNYFRKEAYIWLLLLIYLLIIILTAKNPDELISTIQKIADKIEPGTIITQLEENASNYKEKIYLIENLDCANCGAKISTKYKKIF